MFRKELVCEVMDWIHVTQDRVQWRDFASTEISLRILQKTVKCKTTFNSVSI